MNLSLMVEQGALLEVNTVVKYLPVTAIGGPAQIFSVDPAAAADERLPARLRHDAAFDLVVGIAEGRLSLEEPSARV